MKNLLFLFFLSFISIEMNAQLADHRWEDRVLLIFAKDESSTLFLKQLEHLEADKKGLADRDLVIYQIFEDRGKTSEGKKLETKTVEQWRKRYSIDKDGFTIILLGKDGGEKLRKTQKILDREQLYDTIDVMPMRRSEIRRKKNG